MIRVVRKRGFGTGCASFRMFGTPEALVAASEFDESVIAVGDVVVVGQILLEGVKHCGRQEPGQRIADLTANADETSIRVGRVSAPGLVVHPSCRATATGAGDDRRQ